MPKIATLTGPVTDLHLFFPITRVDDEARIVEGYAFVNEVVDGEGGIRLLRSAMEAATEDYMRWGAVREMHTASAVGTALADGCGITWDEKGALLRAKIVDDAAWKKVKEGVYRGFSLGAAPKLIRGRNVEKVSWNENSLVDRPKDTDCAFTLFRLDDGGESPEIIEEPAEVGAEAEASPEPNEDSVSRAQDSTTVPSRENLEGPASDTHYSCGAGAGTCHAHTTRGGAQECMDRQAAMHAEHVSAIEDHLNTLKSRRGAEAELTRAAEALRADLDAHPEAGETLVRMAGALVELAPEAEAEATPEAEPAEPEASTSAPLTRSEFESVISRLETTETELATVRSQLSTAKEQISRLAAQPGDHRPPVRYPQALERTFAANEGNAEDPKAKQALLDEWQTLNTEAPSPSAAEQTRRAMRISELKPLIHALQFEG